MKQKIDFGLKIKQLIDKHGETLEEAAKRVGGSKSNLSKIVKKEDVNTELLRAFGEAYGVGLGYFFRDFVQYNQTAQSAGIQAVGEKIISYETNGKKEGVSNKDEVQTKILIERVKGLESENKLLREMVELLKNR